MNSKTVFCLILSFLFFACHKHDANISSRSFHMGFMNSGPRPDFTLYIQSLNTWSLRSDAAIISTEVPWDSLLSGESPYDYIIHNYAGQVQFYRQKNFGLWVYIDPENGLDRQSDAIALVNRGKSISDPDMQSVYVRFVVLMDSILHPDHLGLALETNLIRGTAAATIYNGIRQATATAAASVRQFDPAVPLSVSVQVDYAWGKLTGQSYTGIDQDLIDFPFLQELGLSSYPYLVFNSPADMPDDFYARLVSGKNLPVALTESGWTSAAVPNGNGGSVTASGLLQQQYIARQETLLNKAKALAWFQLTFTDIDLAALPANTPDNLKYFTFIGLVDTLLQPKPALATWDSIFHQTIN